LKYKFKWTIKRGKQVYIDKIGYSSK